MRIYKFRINTENLKEEDHDLMDCRFLDLLGNFEDNFLLENIDSDFVLDYVEKNGKEKFESDILKFIPKFFDKI